MSRLHTRILDGGSIEIHDRFWLVAPVVDDGRSRRWRLRLVEHVSQATGVPRRDVIRAIERAELIRDLRRAS